MRIDPARSNRRNGRWEHIRQRAAERLLIEVVVRFLKTAVLIRRDTERLIIFWSRVFSL
jgi:hypothetical protein